MLNQETREWVRRQCILDSFPGTVFPPQPDVYGQDALDYPLIPEDDGRIVRERAEKMDLDISQDDVNRMELALDAEHEKFVTKELERRKGVANQ